MCGHRLRPAASTRRARGAAQWLRQGGQSGWPSTVVSIAGWSQPVRVRAGRNTAGLSAPRLHLEQEPESEPAGPPEPRAQHPLCISYIFFSRFVTFFSRFYVRSLEYSYVFSDPNMHFGSEVLSYPKNVPTVFLKIGVSEA